MSVWIIKQHESGWNPVPWNTRESKPVLPEYIPYRYNPPTISQIRRWIPLFEKYGVAQITGLCRRGKFRGLYLNCVDIDDGKIMNKLLEMYTLDQLIRAGIFVEQHYDNKGKGHFWILSTKPFPKLPTAAKGKGLELKTMGELCNSFPSFNKGGYRYFPVDNSLEIFDANMDALTNDGFIKVIDKLVDAQYLNGNTNTNYNRIKINIHKIPVGSRHNTLLSYANSLISRLYKTTERYIIQKYFELYNQEKCEVPYGSKEGPKQRDELKELEGIFNDAWKKRIGVYENE